MPKPRRHKWDVRSNKCLSCGVTLRELQDAGRPTFYGCVMKLRRVPKVVWYVPISDLVSFFLDSCTLRQAELETPKESSVELVSTMRDPDTGVSIRFIRAWDNRISAPTR